MNDPISGSNRAPSVHSETERMRFVFVAATLGKPQTSSTGSDLWEFEWYSVDDMVNWIEERLDGAWECDARHHHVAWGRVALDGSREHNMHASSLREALEFAIVAIVTSTQ